MRMVSSCRFARIEDYEPLRVDTAPPYSRMEDYKTQMFRKIIENAAARPPHLVFAARLGSSSDTLGSLLF